MTTLRMGLTLDCEKQIFVSYAHHPMWNVWVRGVFVPRLQGYLDIEAGNVRVFVDDQIQTGARWDDVLKQAVARSTLMVPVLSATYFQREWCRREMALMLERERELNMFGGGENSGLLIPVRIGGRSFPDLVEKVQYRDFEKYADPDLAGHSRKISDFNQKLRSLARDITDRIARAPAYSDEWQKFTGEDFFPHLMPKTLAVSTPSRLIV